MSGSISSNDIHGAVPPNQSVTSSGVKKTAKPSSAEKSGVKLEADSYVNSGAGEFVHSAGEELPPIDYTGQSLITAGDIYAFVAEYNQLPEVLGDFFYSVRMEVHKPVRLNGQNRQISLYETGVAHSPDSHEEGALAIDKATLLNALASRGAEVHALFLQEQNGLLKRLCSLVLDKKGAEPFLRVCAGIIYDRRDYD